MATRGLTDGERDIVSSIFGSNINLDAVEIMTDRIVLGLQNTIIVDKGRISWPTDLPLYPYRDDFSTGNAYIRGWFIHEITHVWEVQHGVDVYGIGFRLHRADPNP